MEKSREAAVSFHAVVIACDHAEVVVAGAEVVIKSLPPCPRFLPVMIDNVLDVQFPGTHSFVIGSPVNVQFMVKDSKKYAATGGWGFADFTNGKPGDKALHETCFPCHVAAKDRDFVFTNYALAP